VALLEAASVPEEDAMATLAVSEPKIKSCEELPLYRPLKVYAFDPTRGRSLGNYMCMQTKYEALRPGPVGDRLAVIDYDASNHCYYQAVDLDDPFILLQGGLPPSESDPRFHQQMVYAVASETIQRFEFALGRQIHWRTDHRPKESAYHGLLRIFPHAVQEANAYYDPTLRALLFGYFSASETDSGENLPGQTVFTCLSHDIVAHETTHAVVDGLRDAFMDPAGPDTPAFHEAFADIVALFQHFRQTEALVETIRRTGGLIYAPELKSEAKPGKGGPLTQVELTESNPLVDLAKQFGEGMGTRKTLRSALGTRPNSHDLERLFEPHARGAILVAAVFDAFFSIYIRRTRDLMRIARSGGYRDGMDLDADLVTRLAKEAAKTADQFLNICIRAIDYCVPVAITFGEFLRAMITADYDLVPNDPLGFRKALIDAFRSRGIRPEGVTSYSEESLRWDRPEAKFPIRCDGLDTRVRHQLDAESFRRVQTENAKKLNAFGKTYADVLGLAPDLGIQAHSFHPIHRVGPDGQLEIEMVAELLQEKAERLGPDDPKSVMQVRGGVTLLFDEDGVVRYAVRKSLKTKGRTEQQRQYLMELMDSSAAATYGVTNGAFRPNFASIHRGY
jgi:hypothetical protein